MQLAYTPRSHFARKVRILLHAMEVDVELVDVGNVADPQPFGGNPLMKVPTLVDGDTFLIESDHIAAHLVRRFQPSDPYQVLSTDPTVLNARSLLNGVMAAEVEFLLARRCGLSTDNPRFDKLAQSITRSLDWLETHADRFDGQTYLGFHLVCMWDHLLDSGVSPLAHPFMERQVGRLSALAMVHESRP